MVELVWKSCEIVANILKKEIVCFDDGWMDEKTWHMGIPICSHSPEPKTGLGMDMRKPIVKLLKTNSWNNFGGFAIFCWCLPCKIVQMQRDEEDPQDCCHHSLHLNHFFTLFLNHLFTFSSLLTKCQNMDLNLAQRSAKSFLLPLSYSDKF